MKLKRYVRTESGDIWELDLNKKSYRKPNVLNCVELNSPSIVKTSDFINDLVMPGDLLIFENGKAELVTDTANKDNWSIKKLYTTNRFQSDFRLQVYNTDDWILR